MKIFTDIEKVLQKDDRLWSKDEKKKLLKNKLVELVSNDDEKLLELLLNNKETKTRFFKEIKDSTLFLKDTFLQFITMNEFLPDSFTAFENEIGLSDDRKLITQKDEISLVFPHKDCLLEGGQTKEEGKRDEIFYNTILAPDEIDRIKEPKVLANWKKFDRDGGHEVKEVSKKDNLIIKGNNLLALYSLLPKYRGEIKLIYIDPPYNTGNDEFGYNDKFNHSAWLTFMKNRLEVAKDLLNSNGAIFISINWKELPYLQLLCNEVFGAKNYLNLITIESASTASYRSINACPVNVSEYILVYAKNKDEVQIKPIYIKSGYSEDYSHFFEKFDSKDVSKSKLISLDEIVYKNNGVKDWKEFKNKYGEDWQKIRKELKAKFAFINKEMVVSLNTLQKPSKDILAIIDKSKSKRGIVFKYDREKKSPIYIYNGRTLAFYSSKLREVDGEVVPTEILTNIWTDISYLSLGGEGGVELINGKKPEKLIKRLLDLITDKDDLVLDFFAGAGTTGAVAHKMGRKYILVEQMDYIHELPEARLKNVIKGDQTGISKTVNWKDGGSFIYTELLEWNQKYINQLEKAKTQKEILAIYKKMEKEQFYRYKYEPKKFNLKQFKELDLKDQKKALLDILDMNHLYVNRSSVDDTTFKVDEKDKKLTRAFYEEK